MLHQPPAHLEKVQFDQKQKDLFSERFFYSVSNLRHPTSFALRHSKWELVLVLDDAISSPIYGVFTVDRQLSQPLSVLDLIRNGSTVRERKIRKSRFFSTITFAGSELRRDG